MSDERTPAVGEVDVGIDRDVFLRNLLRELSGTLEHVVGLEEAAGFISLVGQRIGDWMNAEYRLALGRDPIPAAQIPEVLVDLKSRIQGDFYVLEQDADRVVLGNRCCPFGDTVVDRSSMCMMTSNVFGTVTAENLGYAKVCLDATIARGDPECRVTVHTAPTDAARLHEGREYFQA